MLGKRSPFASFQASTRCIYLLRLHFNRIFSHFNRFKVLRQHPPLQTPPSALRATARVHLPKTTSMFALVYAMNHQSQTVGAFYFQHLASRPHPSFHDQPRQFSFIPPCPRQCLSTSNLHLTQLELPGILTLTQPMLAVIAQEGRKTAFVCRCCHKPVKRPIFFFAFSWKRPTFLIERCSKQRISGPIQRVFSIIRL